MMVKKLNACHNRAPGTRVHTRVDTVTSSGNKPQQHFDFQFFGSSEGVLYRISEITSKVVSLYFVSSHDDEGLDSF